MNPAGANTTSEYCGDEPCASILPRRAPPSEWRRAATLEDTIANPPPGQRPVLQDLSLPEKR